jgi:hypothetical protein
MLLEREMGRDKFGRSATQAINFPEAFWNARDPGTNGPEAVGIDVADRFQCHVRVNGWTVVTN